MTRLTRRRAILALGGGLAALAGCLGRGGSGGDSAGDSPSTTTETNAAGLPTRETSLPMMHDAATLRRRTESGGPPKDGIPSIDSPEFEPVSEVGDRLGDASVVFGVVRDGVKKAYPQRILVWHEIVNDTIAGTPVTVSYCPLTGTAQGFHRGETTFGVSGNLVNSNLVMYDRETDSRWPQVLATAVKGPFKGRSLEEFRVVWTTWGRWREANPDGEVLTENTGHARNYNRDPYGRYDPDPGGYYSSQSTLFPPLAEDDRYPPKEPVIGVRDPELGVHAFRKASVRDAGVMAAGDLLAVHEPTLDTVYTYQNPAGTSFEHGGERVRGPDGEYAPDALPLDRVLGFDAMWFAWFGFYPETEVHD